MKKKRLLLCIIGGILAMAPLTGCGEKMVTDNRTEKAYEVEQVFQPLFDFLAEEEKDFSNVERYVSRVFVSDSESDTETTYEIDYSDGIGEYSIVNAENEVIQSAEVTLSGNNLVYPDSNIEAFPQEWFFVTIAPSFFQKLDITDFIAEHSETYMKDITYETVDDTAFLTGLKTKFGLSPDSKAHISLHATSEDELQISVTFFGKAKSVLFVMFLTLKNEGE